VSEHPAVPKIIKALDDIEALARHIRWATERDDHGAAGDSAYELTSAAEDLKRATSEFGEEP
jgi:hypothetical protein